MKVLLTGAAGVLAQALLPLLEQEEGIELRLTDIQPVETDHPFVKADLARWDDVQGLCEDVDQVLHVAAIHPWKHYTPQQYLDCNIKGTYNLLEAAAKSEVQRVVYTSSIAAMGYAAESPRELPFDETKPCEPTEGVYGISKHAGEQFCRMFRRRDGLAYLVLRPGTFVPRDEDDADYGIGLLTHCVHVGDVAAAHLLALRSDLEDETFVIAAKTPFTRDDGPALAEDAPAVVLEHFPEAAKLEELGIELPQHIRRCYAIDKAEKLLGYKPQHNFAQWLQRKLEA
ncbi:MAG: NAD-dependent epimerase/dehydratase family protein [Candidatus Brocadiia bacterium]